MARYSHTKRYFGTFTNSKGITKEAYLEWSGEKKGFVLRDAATNMPLTTTAYSTFQALVDAGVKFERNTVVTTIPTDKEAVTA